MKYVIAFMITFAVLGAASAHSEITILDSGQVLTKGGSWVISDIVVTEEAKKYPTFVNKAYNNPNKDFVVKTTVIDTKLVNLFFAEKTTSRTVVVYDYANSLIDSNDAISKSLFIISFPLFLSIMVMFVIFIFFARVENISAIISFAIVSIVSILFTVSSLDILGERQLLFIFTLVLALSVSWLAVKVKSAVGIVLVLILLLTRIFYEPLF